MSNSPLPYVGVATPQANPTVEIELRRLLEKHAVPLATRLTSAGTTSAERLTEYLEQIGHAIGTFDNLPIAAFAFACTGSSYLLGHEREITLLEQAQRDYRLPVVTATQAIAEELRVRKTRRIAILAPYPQALIDASVKYWQDLGFEVTHCERIDVGDDTRAIYALTDAEVHAALCRVDKSNAHLTLLSGTGMPSITALLAGSDRLISSNLCLTGAVLRRTDRWRANRAIDIHTLLRE